MPYGRKRQIRATIQILRTSTSSMKPIKHAWLFRLALAIVFALLIPTTALMVQIPAPALAGYFDLEDSVVFIAALLFGPFVGGLAGGIGSAVSDLICYPLFTPYTLVIKGVGGWLVGRTAGRTLRSDWMACAIGGIEMVAGFLVVENFLSGIEAALEGLPFNILRVVAGVAIGPPAAMLLRKMLPSTLTLKA